MISRINELKIHLYDRYSKEFVRLVDNFLHDKITNNFGESYTIYQLKVELDKEFFEHSPYHWFTYEEVYDLVKKICEIKEDGEDLREFKTEYIPF